MAEYRPVTKDPLRFGVFEIDPSVRELRKHGVRIKLQDQPFAVLLILLEKPGQLVTKEELQQRLWPADTFVEFDKGIYNAIKRLRETLGDEAETPRYIETLPRRGYRFIAPVQSRDGVGEGLEFPPVTERASRLPGTNRLALLVSCLCLLVLAVIVIRLKLRSSPPVPKVVDSVQITNDGLHKDATLQLLTDGTRLYFQEGAFAGPRSTVAPGFLQSTGLVQMSTQGGETARIPVALEEPLIYDFSTARSEFLVGGRGDPSERPLWVLPLPAGPPHRVGNILALDACWSPDGNHLAFVKGEDLFVAKPDRSEVRKLATLDSVAYWIRYSPDGTRLRFTVFTLSGHPKDWDIMEIGADGSGLRRLPIHGCCGKWSVDGKYYFYQTDRDVWVLPERRTIFGGVEPGTPAQLTTGPITFGAPTPSADGKQLFVIGEQPRIELVHYESRTKQFVPFLGGISAGELEVSPDGQWVTYTTFPESNLWRSKLDGSERLQLTFPPVNAHEPRWSPDGKQILFTDVPRRMFIVPADGGSLQQVMPKGELPTTEVGAGFWMPDGKSIVFVMGSEKTPYAIYRLSLKTQEVSKIPGSDGLLAARVSRDGRYMTAYRPNKTMLYDFQTQQWSEFAGGGTWSHDSKSVYSHRKNGDQSAEVVRISVPGGEVERVLDLKGVTLGGYWPGWVSLLPDDSPLLMLDKSTQEIYRLDLQFR
jgi:DNA-binding winged helix-turn-helix (wHTH) protein/Tol biopolymer transport system component